MLSTFHLQFNFLPPTNSPITSNSLGPVFIMDDGSQPKIELASRDRNLIASTFTHFLIKNIGGSETFKDKQDFFYHEVGILFFLYNSVTKQFFRFENSIQTITTKNSH